MRSPLMDKIETEFKQKKAVDARVGDTVKVHFRIREGDKDRVQIFSGIVIARDGGGVTETFTVRRVSHGVGVERVFPLHSPRIKKMEVEGSGHVRRAKLYFLRGKTGKKTRLRERIRKSQEPL